MQVTVLAAVSTVILLSLKRYLDFRNALHSIGNHPGSRVLFSPMGVFGFLLKKPRKYITKGSMSLWRMKYSEFQEHGVDIVSSVYVFPTVRVAMQVADPAAIKEITTHRARFPKPVQQYRILQFWGNNIVASEGEEWKKFRKISAPAFSEKNNRLVWEETVRIMVDLFDNLWENKPEVVVDHAVDLTLPIALFVIGVAGFGRRISWKDDLIVPPNHKLAFKDALHVVSTELFIKLLTPEFIMKRGVTESMRRVNLAYTELEQYMVDMIDSRRGAEKKEERYDLFSSLLDASEDESDGQAKLSDRELLGNIFIFLLAGHETTAHTLSFTFGLLALYPDEQEKLYQHIKSIIPDGRIPNYEEMNLFTQSMAVFYETLRMFPPVTGIPKFAAEDTSLLTTDSEGNKVTIPIPQGATIALHVPALHNNPKYWDEPESFKPDRFLGDWPRDAFLPFSAGARSCLGRRFFETEGIAILTMLMARYKVEIKEEPEFAAETFEQRRARILNVKQGLTLSPVRLPLVFKRRY